MSALAQDLPAGLIVQYGFSVKGVNANPIDESILGSVIIGDAILQMDHLKQEKSNVYVYPNPALSTINIYGLNDIFSIYITK